MTLRELAAHRDGCVKGDVEIPDDTGSGGTGTIAPKFSGEPKWPAKATLTQQAKPRIQKIKKSLQ